MAKQPSLLQLKDLSTHISQINTLYLHTNLHLASISLMRHLTLYF